MAAEVVVVGSLNLDLSVQVERLPEPGETIIGSDLVFGGGGKGANQAVAAARLGRQVVMVGGVGDDDAGRRLLAELEAFGVNIDSVRLDPDNPTGTAIIEVDGDGENRIVVVPGANGALDRSVLEAAEPDLAQAKVVLTQFETPLELIADLRDVAPSATIVVNPAPAVDTVAKTLALSVADYVVPNRHELASLDNGRSAESTDELIAQAHRVLERYSNLTAVIVTLGSEGVVLVDGGTPRFVDAVKVPVVDTTAAGDAFCGGFADGLLETGDYLQAASWAVRVAAAAVTRHGAQASLASRSQVLAL